MSESAYNSPLLARKLPDSCFSSPARSIASFGEPASLTDSELTETESESLDLVTEVPGAPDQTVVDGWVKFRDNKRWKQRWGVVTKLSPAADCLHLQLYRDSKDRYKQGQTKASLSLQHFLGVESGFTLDKESNTIAIICQDVIVVLAFDTRERLIQWQVKISNNLGDDQQFLILVSSAPPKAKITSGPARMHVQDHRFCLTSGVPPRLTGIWEIGHLRRYGVVEGRFCFEGGSRCGKGEGLYVLVTDQGEEITETLKMASQGKLTTKRRPASRKSSNMDSPRRIQTRSEARMSDLSCAEPFLSTQQSMQCDMNRSIYGDESCCNHNSDATPCTCRTSSPFWSTESAVGHHNHPDLDSNYGCGDTASVSEMHDIVHNETWNSEMGYPGRGMPTSLERCMSCISKLGAPSMSRSSTATASGTPGAPPLFSPAWTMENMNQCAHNHQQNNTLSRSIAGNNSDRMSLCSHGSSSGNSEYSVPRLPCGNQQECTWHDRTHGVTTPPPQPLPIPPKSPKVQAMTQNTMISKPPPHPSSCQCAPARPPKPAGLSSSANNSPIKKAPKKPPMPLPITAPLNSMCSCQAQKTEESSNPMAGPYENYDVPKMPFLVEPKNEDIKKSSQCDLLEHYDTPKKIKECLAAEIIGQFGNYDTPNTVNVRKPCGCILKFNKPNTVFPEPKVVDQDDIRPTDCPCRRVICWPGNWMTLPYCRRGNGIENTSLPQKICINGETKMSVMQPSGEVAIYATVDMSKKANRRNATISDCKCGSDSSTDKDSETSSNYVNIEPMNLAPEPAASEHTSDCANYANIDFAQSLEYYENAKELLQRAGITKEELAKLESENAVKEKLTYIISNGVKVCNKCGHACQSQNKESEDDSSNNHDSNKQDDYLMMEPAKGCKSSDNDSSPDITIKQNKNFPGYLPMSPAVSASTTSCNKPDLLKQCVNKLICEKSASNPSLIGPAVDRSRKRSDSDVRIPGSAMLMLNHPGNSPYIRRQIMDSTDSLDRRASFLARKRSSSADSTRYIEDDLESALSRTTSPSSETLRKSSVHSLNSTVEQIPCTEHRMSSPCLHQEAEPCYDSDCCRKAGVDVNSNETEDEVSSTTDSLRTQVQECLVNQQAVNIRRSSSVPCKSGQNRDSSSSNDSGVSTGSLRQRGGDFAEFELPLTTAKSSRRHHHAIHQQLQGTTMHCLHSSLPRRSKSSDPLRELTFQFQKDKIPAKSSSAEAEVPICPAKNGKGYSSPGDGTMGPPYMDSRSTSSGTSDMSDYIETLSLSSHSSSDAPDSLRLIRPATTTLRPRSGKEYLNIDRAMLMSDSKGCVSGLSSQQMRSILSTSAYANIAPVPEKSESPSPGYMSGSSPAQEMPSQPGHFSFQKTN